ncbi:hypothetical protein PRIPAC_96428, partial [Pristionchus pacificus]
SEFSSIPLTLSSFHRRKMTRAVTKKIEMDYTESEEEVLNENKDSTIVARFVCIPKANNGEFSGCKFECCVCLHIFPTATAFNDHKRLEYCFRLVRRAYDPEPSNIIVPIKRSEESLPELTREEKKEAVKAEREKLKKQKRENRAYLRALYGYPSLEQMKAEMEQRKIDEQEDEEVQRYNEQADARARRERRKKEKAEELEKKKVEDERKAALDSVKEELRMFGKIRKEAIRKKEKEMIKKNMERIERDMKSKKEEEKRKSEVKRKSEEKERIQDDKRNIIEEETRLREEEEEKVKTEDENRARIEDEKIREDVEMTNEEMKEEKTEEQKKEKIGDEMEEKKVEKMKRKRITADVQMSEETLANITENRRRKRRMDEDETEEESAIKKKKANEAAVDETTRNGEGPASEPSSIFPQAEQYKSANTDESKTVDPKKWKKKSEMRKIQIILTDKQSASLFSGLKTTTGDGTNEVYECAFCLDKMSTLDAGRRHMLSHVRVIRFRCRLCDAGAFYSIDMQNHLKNGDCSEMKKAFKQLHFDNLPEITKKHTDELTIIANPQSPGAPVFTNGKIVSITSAVPYLPDPTIEKEMLKPKPAEM